MLLTSVPHECIIVAQVFVVGLVQQRDVELHGILATWD